MIQYGDQYRLNKQNVSPIFKVNFYKFCNPLKTRRKKNSFIDKKINKHIL